MRSLVGGMFRQMLASNWARGSSDFSASETACSIDPPANCSTAGKYRSPMLLIASSPPDLPRSFVTLNIRFISGGLRDSSSLPRATACRTWRADALVVHFALNRVAPVAVGGFVAVLQFALDVTFEELAGRLGCRCRRWRLGRRRRRDGLGPARSSGRRSDFCGAGSVGFSVAWGGWLCAGGNVATS